MGIRVVCPNGHKLNVKSFLAGKRGVCPHCSAKFDIPAGAEGSADEKMQSVGTVSQGGGTTTATASAMSSGEVRASHLAKGPSGRRQAAPAGGAGMAPATPVVPVTTVAHKLPSAVPVQPIGPVAGVPVVGIPTVDVQPFAAQPVVPAAAMPGVGVAAARPVLADPLAEAPEACWYVRPPTGGQYGPAKPNTMRQWIAEGRVTADSLVWREGWPDWKIASVAFPDLGGVGGAGGPAGVTVQPVVVPAMPAADDPFAGLGLGTPSLSGSRKPLGARRSDGTGRVVAIAVLCMALVVLAALLVYVLKLR